LYRPGEVRAWRFLREARVTGQLQHPGVAPVYDLARTVDGLESFFTMRFISGRTLSQAARECHRARKAGNVDPLALRELLTAFVGICQVIVPSLKSLRNTGR
jgi:eukaryotic-like serine/threonine-protein kinase